MNFQPNSERSKREVLYQAIRDKPSEEVIPYADLPFDYDVVSRLREPVAKTFEREQQRTVVCVRGHGWKIVRGVDQVDVAVRKRRQGTRRLGRALQVITATDRREMSGEDRQRTDAELIKAAGIYRAARSFANKRLGVKDIERWQEDHPNGN